MLKLVGLSTVLGQLEKNVLEKPLHQLRYNFTTGPFIRVDQETYVYFLNNSWQITLNWKRFERPMAKVLEKPLHQLRFLGLEWFERALD